MNVFHSKGLIMQPHEIEILIGTVTICFTVVCLIVFTIWDYETIANKLF